MMNYVGLYAFTFLMLASHAIAGSGANHVDGQKPEASANHISDSNRPRAHLSKSSQDLEALYNQYQAQAALEEGRTVPDGNEASEIEESAEADEEEQETEAPVQNDVNPDAPVEPQEEEDSSDTLDRAEQELNHLKQLMRRLRRHESGGVSLLEVKEAKDVVDKLQRQRATIPGVSLLEKSGITGQTNEGDGGSQDSAEGARVKTRTFPASQPVTLEDYRAYQICNLTLAKAYNLLKFEIRVQTIRSCWMEGSLLCARCYF